MSAYEVVLETSPRLSSTQLTFNSSSHPPPLRCEKASTSEVTAWGMQAIIVGWSLSCQAEDRRVKAFTLKKGGLNHDHLSIEVKILKPVMWRCRIYFVNRYEGYSFNQYWQVDPAAKFLSSLYFPCTSLFFFLRNGDHNLSNLIPLPLRLHLSHARTVIRTSTTPQCKYIVCKLSTRVRNDRAL